jgi:hypothetical protein
MSEDESAKLTAQSEPKDSPEEKPAAPGAEVNTIACATEVDAEEESEPDSFDDSAPPSAKVDHDFLPALPVGEELTEIVGDSSSLVPCAGCATALEPWQLACHHCGCIAHVDMVPPVVAQKGDRAAVMASFSDWLKSGIAACDAARFSEAQNCFNEALARVKGVDDAARREVEVRKQLAIALERQEKRAEASAQYLALAKLTEPGQDEFEKRARELSMSTTDVLARINTGNAVYRAAEGKESRLVPLYCCHCRQLLVEAEVHGFRNGRSTGVRREALARIEGRTRLAFAARITAAMRRPEHCRGTHARHGRSVRTAPRLVRSAPLLPG